jgi:hypothetical protein
MDAALQTFKCSNLQIYTTLLQAFLLVANGFGRIDLPVTEVGIPAGCAQVC